MEKNPDILLEKESKALTGDLGSIGIGAALGGPFGAALGLGANRLYRWARAKYLKNKQNKQNQKNNNLNNTTSKPEKSKSDEEPSKKTKNDGMFNPELYKIHRFYKTTIYDLYNPKENNFVYISKNRNGSKAYEGFLDYWLEKYKQKRKINTPSEINNFIKLIKERFKTDINKPCLISVPQYFIIDNCDVLSMAKNSDIVEQTNVIYDDIPSFDSNYAFDVHMYQNKNEDVEDDVDEYKTSLISFNLFDTDYVCACKPGIDVDLSKISESVILSLGQEFLNDDDDKLYKFSKIVERMVDTEQKRINVYCVATPLLIKDARTAHDLEYNACLLDGLNLYESEEEFKDNYLEEYQKLINNQMGI